MAYDKAVDSSALDTGLTSIANAIRAKGETSEPLEFPSDFVTAIENIPTGGGGSTVPKLDVNFYDYDGTILYSYTASDALALTALPANPSHDGLTAQGWNYTLAQMQAEVTNHGYCDVGQMYITDDGKTRLYCTFEEGRLSPYLGICPNGTVVIDWGDGSTTDTVTGTSLTTCVYTGHTYATAGDYVITLSVSSGEFAFYGTSTNAYVLSTASSASNILYYNYVYCSALKRIEIGSSVTISSYAFLNCLNLNSASVPASTEIRNYAFSNTGLQHMTIPTGNTQILRSAYQSSSIISISIPYGVTFIDQAAFSNCTHIERIVLPTSVTTMNSNVFYNCYNLRELAGELTSIGSSICYLCALLQKITVASSVTNVPGYAFHNCVSMKEYHFLPTTPPTLASTSAFNNIQSGCKIYVPAGSLSAYQSASNWSTYASYMVEET